MISATCWIRKGVAKQIPEKFELDEEQYNKILRSTKEEIQVAKRGLQDMETDPSLEKYKMDDYDDEGEEDAGKDFLFSNHTKLAYYENGDDDPYVKFHGEEETDLEDLKILPSDSLILAARTEDDVSYLDVYVYEEENDNLYVHHDLMLPSFPICIEWIDYSSSETHGNLAAVGTFDPEIEVWDLDVLEAACPKIILGQSSRKGKDKSKSRHVDAVMCLSWNAMHRNILASGSADHTIKLWDIAAEAAVSSIDFHSGKVQAVEWNSFNSSVLLSGSYDRNVCVYDSRTPKDRKIWSMNSDIECAKWNPQYENIFAVSDESGLVQCYDIRKDEPLYNIHAHSKSTSSLDWNPYVPDFLLTGSTDQTLKLWNLHNNEAECIVSKDLGIGKVFSASFSKDSPYLVSAAGSEGIMSIWNLCDVLKFKAKLDEKMNKDL